MRILDSEKRVIISRIARKHFKKRGFAKTSMNIIAQEAGLAVGTLYLYFPNKAELLKGTVQDFIDDHLALISDINLSKSSSKQKLIRYIKSRFEAVKEVRSQDDIGAELNRKIFEHFPGRRKHESDLMVRTVVEILKQGLASREFKNIKNLEENVMVFMHAISWFFLPSDEFYDEAPSWKSLRNIIGWFIIKWKE